MKRFALIVAAAAVILGVTTVTAGAASADEERKTTPAERAHVLYDLSAAAYEAGRFQESVDLLLRAYDITPKPVLLFNLARAYEGLGESKKAIAAYEAYLQAESKAADRGSIERRLVTLRKELADRAALEKERDESARRAEREHLRALEEQKKAEAAEEARRKSPLPWVIASVGGGGIIAGLTFGALSRSRSDAALQNPYQRPASSDLTTAKGYATAANVGFIGGSVLAVVGMTWGIIQLQRSPTSQRSARIDLRVSPSSVGLAGSF
jgi:tetratricopeptide (TPR) repeat protein